MPKFFLQVSKYIHLQWIELAIQYWWFAINPLGSIRQKYGGYAQNKKAANDKENILYMLRNTHSKLMIPLGYNYIKFFKSFYF
jgi:hypothetical protein